MLSLNSPLEELNRVGKTNAKLLKKLGLGNIQDLLFYFPYRYDDFTKNSLIADLEKGQNANIIGTVELIQNRKSFKRRIFVTEALVADESETIKIIWFNQAFLTKTLKVGDKISIAGMVSENNGQLAFISPQYEKVYDNNLVNTSGLIPNYHSTENLTQKQIRYLIKQVIGLRTTVEDWLPKKIKDKLNLIDLSEALYKIHFPKSDEEVLSAKHRLAYNEIFLLCLKAQIVKEKLKKRQAQKIIFQKEKTKEFVDSLPFKLSDAQKKSAWEILKDLDKETPMNRLLEGDVGSGKTLVAIMAILNTALNKKQSALMVPTGILASQHFNSLTRILAPYNFKIGLMTGSKKPADYKDLDIIIGTHALIADKVKFDKLALVIVDEQHRFGVEQRQRLLTFNDNTNKLTPHFLSMTATPIPRSLALTLYGDLDLSIIDEMPIGRKKIITRLVKEDNRNLAYEFIRKEIKNGRQAYVICPMIDESDRLGVKSVKAEHLKLDEEIFPELKVGLLHGKMKAKEKEAVMQEFLAGKISVIVATSLIEVGIDVPNATLMIIEGADRFGLAQLHQFRGRIGRSDLQSYCFLFPSREEISNPKTLERLDALTKYNDGFELAKIDLKLRGEGELYGLSQSGWPELQIASIFDYEIIKEAKNEIEILLRENPELNNYPLLKNKLTELGYQTHSHLE
jgi:ATP-dependent DNA helicase RecG